MMVLGEPTFDLNALWQSEMRKRYWVLYGDVPSYFKAFQEEELDQLSSTPHHLAMLLHVIHENRQNTNDIRYFES